MPSNRRDFLRQAALGVALGSTTPPLFAQPMPDSTTSGSSAAKRPVFHSRHIPKEWLNFQTKTAVVVERNRLCDTLQPDMLKRLADMGVEVIETRLVWWELEPAAGRYDWSRVERCIDAIEHAGLKPGLMPWTQHPPEWYNRQETSHARYRCLEHGQDSTILSHWDPKTLEVYERILAATAERLGQRLAFIYTMVSGDYGEVFYPTGVKHYLFSPPHGHGGFWSGDVKARASFAKALQQQYGTLDKLNAAWGTSFSSWQSDLMPRMPLESNGLKQRDDCVTWYTESMLSFTEAVCRVYQKYFPHTPSNLAIGALDEPAYVGQIKSRAVKIGAKYKRTARFTGLGGHPFGRGNLYSRRVASAAHFYGTAFGTEAALFVPREHAASNLYEGLANGASQVHDDPQNIFRAAEVHRDLRPKLLVDPPVTPVAVLYPLESEMLKTPGFSWGEFVACCAEFRRVIDYDVCDSHMIADGYLAGKRDLVIPVTSYLPEQTVKAIVQLAADRGRVWLYGDTVVKTLHSPSTLETLAAQRKLAIRDLKQVGQVGLYHFHDWQETVPHLIQDASQFQIADNSKPCYRTLHQHHESCFFPDEERLELRTR